MRRVWVTVLTVWALLAILAVLAWARHPVAMSAAPASPQVVVVRGANGVSRTVLLPASPAHATTQTSPAAGATSGSAPLVLPGAGATTVQPAAAHATTRTS
jgi:predicted lipid-binding transport protein (Tim44 family)